MSDRFLLVCICLLLAAVAAGTASAQKTPQASKPEAALTDEEDQEPKPEPPRRVLNVEIQNDLLSLELENVDFSAVIKAVGEKAGFKIEGKGEVFGRKLNTKFTNIEVERGVLRLLTLVKETNYMLHYDTKGQISKLEILGIGSGRAPAATTTRQPLRPTPTFRQPADSTLPQSPVTPGPIPRRRIVSPVERRQIITRPSRPGQPAQPVAPPSGEPKPQTADEGNIEEEPVAEIPYVTPQPRLAPTPVR